MTGVREASKCDEDASVPPRPANDTCSDEIRDNLLDYYSIVDSPLEEKWTPLFGREARVDHLYALLALIVSAAIYKIRKDDVSSDGKKKVLDR